MSEKMVGKCLDIFENVGKGRKILENVGTYCWKMLFFGDNVECRICLGNAFFFMYDFLKIPDFVGKYVFRVDETTTFDGNARFA